MNELDDRNLLVRLRQGDKESFRAIFEHYYPRFHSFARRLVRDEDAADDIVQNVFMRLWITRERVDENRSLRNYLLVSIRNEINTHFRTAYTARRTDTYERIKEVAAAGGTPGDEQSARELGQAVERIVESMPARRRDIFRMSRVEHLSNSQIAERLGISVRTVEKHIELALAEIRRHLPVSVLLLVTLLW